MFNLSLLMGISLVGVGVYLRWGLGPSLATVGVLVLLLSLYSAERLIGRR